MGQIFDRISRLAKTYWNDYNSEDLEWAERIVGNEDDELRKAIDQATGKRSHANEVPVDVLKAHRILIVEVGSTVEVVKTAYRKSIAVWHPDRHAKASAEDQKKAQHKAQEINAAYIILKAYYRF